MRAARISESYRCQCLPWPTMVFLQSPELIKFVLSHRLGANIKELDIQARDSTWNSKPSQFFWRECLNVIITNNNKIKRAWLKFMNHLQLDLKASITHASETCWCTLIMKAGEPGSWSTCRMKTNNRVTFYDRGRVAGKLPSLLERRSARFTVLNARSKQSRSRGLHCKYLSFRFFL